MKTLLIVLSILISGCTMYSVEKTPDSTIVKVKSTRSFEQPDLHYVREGNDAEFDFKAASVDNNTDAILGMFNGVMGMMQRMMQMMPVVAPSPMLVPVPDCVDCDQ